MGKTQSKHYYGISGTATHAKWFLGGQPRFRCAAAQAVE
jgi:hypothetical protein